MKDKSRSDHSTWIRYSQKVVGWLMQRGFVLVAATDDKYGSGRKVFRFSDTLEVSDAVGNYLAKDRK